MTAASKQKLTLSLPVETLQKARVLAERRSISISALVAEQVEALVDKDEAYEEARRSALALMDRGFHMGDGKLPSRDELYDR